VVATARLAESCARAAARGDHAEAGRLAADCLYSRRAGAGEEYVLSEAFSVLDASRS